MLKPLAKPEQPQPIETLTPDRQLCCVRFSPDCKELVAGGFDSLVRRWNVSGKKAKELPTWDNDGGWVQGLTFSADGKRLFTADTWGMLRAWNPTGEKPKAIWMNKSAHEGWIRGLTIDPAGQRLATAGIYGAVKLWSADDGKLLRAVKGDGVEMFAVAFSPDGKSIVTGDLLGRVRQYDASTGKQLREFDASVLSKEHRLQQVGGARVISFDDKGERLFIAGTKPKNGGNVQGIPTVLVFNWKTGKLEKTLEFGKTSDVYVTSLTWHPAGYLIVTTSGNPGVGQLIFRRLNEKEPFYTTKKLRNCHSLAFDARHNRFAVTSTNNGSNGNGRRLKNGEYVGNHSPVHLFAFGK